MPVTSRLYSYVGPPEIKAGVQRENHCRSLDCPADLVDWLAGSLSPGKSAKEVCVTYIVDAGGRLWIVDRHSEHVGCADGGEVQAAGELVFEVETEGAKVAEASNQSTGYCPEPSCWKALAAELERLGLPAPQDFTASFIFRRCPACKAINVVKDEFYECDICGAQLPTEWNFA